MNAQTEFIKRLLNPEELGCAVPAHVRDEARIALGRAPVETSKPKPLSWHFDGQGEWTSESALTDEGIGFGYTIGVCDDGTFDVSGSANELLGDDKIDCFPTLQAAKDWCQANETVVLSESAR